MPGKELLDPMVQCGALVLCLALIGLLSWLIKRMLGAFEKQTEVQSQLGAVIERNTSAVEKLAAKEDKSLALLEALNAKLLSRPCIARREEGGGTQ